MAVDIQIIAKQAQIDLTKVGSALEAQFQDALKRLVVASYAEIKRLAAERLKTTRQDYVKALRLEEKGKNTYLIQLADDPSQDHGLPPSWLEGGFSSFDMKPKMLTGPRSHAMKGGGRYNIIPFRHFGEKASTNIRQQLMAQEMKQALKKYGVNAFGQKTDLSKTQKLFGKAWQGKAGKVVGHDMHPNLRGLVKIQKTYGEVSSIATRKMKKAVTQSQYMTFRVVSSNSPAKSWIHPGFKGAKIFPDIEKYLERETRKIMESILK